MFFFWIYHAVVWFTLHLDLDVDWISTNPLNSQLLKSNLADSSRIILDHLGSLLPTLLPTRSLSASHFAPPAGPAGNEIWPLATWRRPSRKHEFLIVSGSRIFQDSICLDLLIFAWICFRFQLFKNLAPLGLRKVLHSQQSSSGIAATCKEREHTSTAQVWSQA